MWEVDRTITNYLWPLQELVSKTRHHAKRTKMHERSATPQQRVMADMAVRTMPVILMNAAFKKN